MNRTRPHRPRPPDAPRTALARTAHPVLARTGGAVLARTGGAVLARTGGAVLARTGGAVRCALHGARDAPHGARTATVSAPPADTPGSGRLLPPGGREHRAPAMTHGRTRQHPAPGHAQAPEPT
ncbi:hypothetical protein [Streptomyces sp. NPDC060002]|uniref:hypothetical protein n=1 Tax=Streptomyces sp. NPDC060002 TaxID=3347033 RepID=UPI0036CB4523